MISTYKHNQVTWVDLENPSQNEILKITERYGLSPEVSSDLLSPTDRPLIEVRANYVYLVLHFPINISENTFDKRTEIQEIDFIMGKDFIITNKYITFDSILDFSKRFTANSVLKKNDKGGCVGEIFFKLMKGLYGEIEDRLEYVNQALQESENDIFNGNEKKMVAELSKLNRLILHFNKSVAIHGETLNHLSLAGQNIFGTEDLRYFNNVLNEYVKVESSIKNLKDYAAELRDTNNSLLFTKQNEAIKILTILAFITFPLTILSGIFSMNTSYVPIVGSKHDFWIIIGMMAGTATVMYAYFKHNKWI